MWKRQVSPLKEPSLEAEALKIENARRERRRKGPSDVERGFYPRS